MAYAVRSVVFAAAGLLLATASLAQSAGGWSAVEAHPVGSRASLGRTVAAGGPAAALQPNAAQPAPGQHLKTNARPLTGALAGILKLRPVQFAYLPGQGAGGAQYGLQPTDLAKVYPDLVKTDLMTGVKTINTNQLTPILIEAIKEQQQQILVLQQQQLQLAQAYADLVRAGGGRPASGAALLRRARDRSANKEVLTLPTVAADTVNLP